MKIDYSDTFRASLRENPSLVSSFTQISGGASKTTTFKDYFDPYNRYTPLSQIGDGYDIAYSTVASNPPYFPIHNGALTTAGAYVEISYENTSTKNIQLSFRTIYSISASVSKSSSSHASVQARTGTENIFPNPFQVYVSTDPNAGLPTEAKASADKIEAFILKPATVTGRSSGIVLRNINYIGASTGDRTPDGNSSWSSELSAKLTLVSASILGERQSIYLDFSENLGARYAREHALGLESVLYRKPAAELKASEVAQVQTDVQKIFKDFNVSITTTRPTSGPYHTIFIGGTAENIANSNPSENLNIPADALGIAQSINLMNSNKSASAVVFSEVPIFTGPGGHGMLSQTIAHEAGHLLGLQHVTPLTELLYPYASASATAISSIPLPLGYIDEASGLVKPVDGGITQNSGKNLLCAVGSSTGVIDCGGADYAVSTTMTFSTTRAIYNARLVVLVPDLDDDTGVAVESLGTINAGGAVKLNIPIYPNEFVIFSASSIDGGRADIFAGGSNSFSGAIDDPNTYALRLTDLFGGVSAADIYLYQLNPDNSFSRIGAVSVSSIPELQTLTLFILGLAAFLLLRPKPCRLAH